MPKVLLRTNAHSIERNRALPHFDSVFAQLLKLVPRQDFNKLAAQHHSGGKLRKMTRWSQFVALAGGHLGRRFSLRDIVANFAAQGGRLYHLGVKPVTRSSLARVNAEQPFELYQSLFALLYTRCQALAPRHGFRFKNKLYSLDASLIDLSLKIFPWSRYALGKGAVKLHMALDHDGLLPAFAVVTESRVMETQIARQLTLPKGSIVVFDRGYSQHAWLKSLDAAGVFFVTRLRANTLYEVIAERATIKGEGITADRAIRFTGKTATTIGMPNLRLVSFDCPHTGRTYQFLTNIHHLPAATIASIYKSRWQIELFFKFLKQNLKLRGFFGTSRNAVLTQIWVALCVALLIAYLKFSAGIGLSFQHILRLIDLNLFLRRDLRALLTGKPPDPSHRHPNQAEFAL